MHNGNVVPTNLAYLGVSSAYEGGTSVFDFSSVTSFPPITNLDAFHGQPTATIPVPPLVGREVAFYDAKADGRGVDDAWSTYWHNDYVYASSGLQRPGQRGFDVYKILLPQGKDLGDPTEPGETFNQQFRARKQPREFNPQTQEVQQGTGWGQGDQTG